MKASPNATAIVQAASESSSGRTLTYFELDRLSSVFAEQLRGYQVKKHDIVPLLVERSPEFCIAVLAILKLGAAYCPIDPNYPFERLQLIVEEVEAPVVLVSRNLHTSMPFNGLTCLPMPTCEELAVAPFSEDFTPTPNSPEDRAYIIYTSGSTGKPKGVEISHAGISNFLQGLTEFLDLGGGERWTFSLSTGFDVSVWEMWGALSSGAVLVTVPQSVLISPKDLFNLLQEERITVFNQTPSGVRRLILAGNDSPLADLRYLLFVGEALPADVAKSCSCYGATAWNLYGPTEASVFATAEKVLPETLCGPTASIGRPLPNYRVSVLDSQGCYLPPLIPGELHIGGIGLAKGYFKRPEISAQSFIEITDELNTRCRWYRTGDLALVREDGTIEFLGRRDCQVKVSGYRIELEEIEAVLSRHPQVACSAAVVREAPGEIRRIFSFVEPARGQVLDVSELRVFLERFLPAYMIPSRFVSIAQLPRSCHGKLDRRLLEQMPDPVSEVSGSPISMSLMESRISEIWNKITGVRPSSIERPFFEEGGSSLLLVRVANEIRVAKLGSPSMLDLFKYPSIKLLARFLETHCEKIPIHADPQIQRRKEAEGRMYVQRERRVSFAARREVVVSPVTGDDGTQTLVAYVVPRLNGKSGNSDGPARDVITKWRTVWDDAYQRPSSSADKEFNTIGWNDSVHGKEFSSLEMREWLDETIKRISALRPRKVLEVGCGTGMILSKIAPSCEQYVALDISTAAIAYVRELTTNQTKFKGVSLFNKAAHELDELPREAFDLVIINSVAQYFPDVDYLVNVVQSALNRLSDGGVIFLGDLRNFELLDAYNRSVEMERAPDAQDVAGLRKRIESRVRNEEELVVSPQMIRVLGGMMPEISKGKTLIRKGKSLNELTRYRFDALIYKQSKKDAAPREGSDTPITVLPWSPGRFTKSEVRRLLEGSVGGALCIRGAPNSRLRRFELAPWSELEEWSTVGALKQSQYFDNVEGLAPHDMWSLADELGYALNVECSSDNGALIDLIFSKNDRDGSDSSRTSSLPVTKVVDLSTLASHPSRTRPPTLTS